MKQGFDHLRPIWAAVREGSVDKSDELQAVATEVWQFRTQLQKDIVAMKLKLAEDPAAKLNLPDYALFSWQ
ncbi:hypothetical protein Q4601_09885 [Shewanella sp. 1_MG-2023]|nr:MULTISPECIES: hypothetical protein [unclassified Shewanella]MDO6611127.1 hypothetical protein [Shewanella sp. 7_MG-2023]MDO6770996.1 hypothetical protein [Shewanella sp. 2_MG-2023]MDO6794617.1 hypothetical protein [Shewanella sp. 1_MG-2023]